MFRRFSFATLALIGAVLAGCALDQPEPPQTAALPASVVGTTWRWVGFTTPVEQIIVDAPDRYTIQFNADGRVALRADCNRGAGSYSVPADRRIAFGPIALTRAACPPESLSDRFAREVGRATSYFMRNGDLFLELPVDSGTLRFVAPGSASGSVAAPKSVALRCKGLENTPVLVVYRQDAQPASAVVTIGGRRMTALSARTASGARYTSNEVDFWEHQGEVTLNWDGKTYTCAVP